MDPCDNISDVRKTDGSKEYRRTTILDELTVVEVVPYCLEDWNIRELVVLAQDQFQVLCSLFSMI
jgi:hypothetical protein